MPTVPTNQELASLFDQSALASEMARRFGLTDQAEIQVVEERCAELHNAETIDLLSLVESDALQQLDGPDFFMATHFFSRILPELDATPARVMACVDALVTRGGGDMAANRPNEAFRTWCAKDASRALGVIAAARSGEDLASRHLTFALEAVSAITEARDIALAFDDDRRLSAVTALGRMEDDDPVSRAETLTTFRSLLDSGADDRLRANMLQATAAILGRHPDTQSPEAVKLVLGLVDSVGEFVVHQSAHIIWAHRQAMQPDIVASLLETLAHLDPANKGTVGELDLGLQSLLEHGHEEAAIAFSTRVLSRQDDGLELTDLGSFANTLFTGPPERISRVVVQWLLDGAPRLCDGLAKGIRSLKKDGVPLNLAAEDLAISPEAQVFICRKAIGWFCLQPTTAASVLVSVLRVCEAETSLKVQPLLVECLLRNYAGVRDYLEGLEANDVAKERVNEALAQNESYLRSLRDIPNIKELEPSEHHRRIERVRMSDQMRDANKQAESQSIFHSLVKRSVILYGNRSLSFIKDGEDKLRPVEMDLKPYQISFEMPRMEIVDPVGLDLMLRVFRYERMSQ